MCGKHFNALGHSGGRVVSVLAFYLDDLSSNPADDYSFFCNFCVWKTEINKKNAGVGTIF